MDRRLALGALWAVFAAASVGVGFGAAGLVGDPFTEPAGVSAGSVVSSSGSGTASPSGSSTGSPSRSGEPSSRASSSGASGPASGPSTRTPAATRSPSTTEVRGVSTRGGYVSASCRDGLVSVSASPAVGWTIEDVDPGRVEDARVRFEGSDDSDQRVEVRAYCAGGVPRFAVEDRDRGSGDGGGSGSSGSGGGDD